MATKKNEQAEEQSLPQKNKGGRPKKKIEPRARQLQIVKELLDKFAVKLKDKEAKATLGDYIRLLQLQKELEFDVPRNIKVGWVDRLENNDDPLSS